MSRATTIVSALRARPRLYGGIALALVALVAGGAIAFGNPPKPATVVVRTEDFAQQISVTGTVQAAEDVNLGFAQSGRVTRVHVKVGDRVAAGTVLAEIENADLAATVASRRAALTTAQYSLTNAAVVNKVDLENANRTLAAQLSSAYTALDTTLTADIDPLFRSARTNPSYGVTIQSGATTYIIDDPILGRTISSQRRELIKLMERWEVLNRSITSTGSNEETVRAARAALAQAQSLASNIATALARDIPSDTSAQSVYNGYKNGVASASATINSSLSNLVSAAAQQESAQVAYDSDLANLAPQGQLADASVAQAQAELDSAQASYAKTLVVAPFSGVVSVMDAKVGAIVSPSDQLISLISEDTYQIESFVPEVYLAGLGVGNEASATLDAYGQEETFPLVVVAIDPAATSVNGVANYRTTLQFTEQSARIRPGMSANVTISKAITPNAVAIPQGAVYTVDGQQYVDLWREGRAERRRVTTGIAPVVGNIEITSGLAEGDEVLLTPAPRRP